MIQHQVIQPCGCHITINDDDDDEVTERKWTVQGLSLQIEIVCLTVCLFVKLLTALHHNKSKLMACDSAISFKSRLDEFLKG
jgi:hypothetical protein